MAARNKHRSWAAFAQETTANVAPADWAADGIPMEHIAVDIAELRTARIADPTLETRVFQKDERHTIEGLRQAKAKLTIKLHGKGVQTAVDAQAAETPLSKLLKHAMGGQMRSNTTTFTGGTASQPIVDDVTNLEPGMLLAYRDATSPSTKFAGKVFWTRVTAIDAGTKTLTVKPVLGFSPSNTDPVPAVIVSHLDEDILESALTSSGAPHTLSWLFKTHKSDTNLVWQLTGSVASMTLGNLGPGQLPQIELNIQGASNKHLSMTNPTFAAEPYGHAQLCLGKDSEVVLASYAGNLRTVVKISAFSFDVGYSRDVVPAVSSDMEDFNGVGDFGVEPGMTTISMTVNAYSTDWLSGLEAGSEWYIFLCQPAAEGKSWSLAAPRCILVEQPQKVEVGPMQGASLKFKCIEPDDAGTTELARSRFLIGLC